jgi:tRNA A-37 threonylcarbamoyl transferase component Bud32
MNAVYRPPMRALAGAGHVVGDRYRLQDQIGRGAMGTVWQARDELLDRDVAVKELVVSPALGPADRTSLYERTLREAKTAARLSHPGVVTVYDVVEEDGRPWIIMELVRARSLEQVLAQDGPLPPAEAAGIGEQLISALAAAHASGVLHRDVKPSNVLLCPDGRAVLTDFGIATVEGDSQLTQTGMVMGTPAFTAPERIRGQPAAPASDFWSLGATLYAAVQGRGPYQERGGPMTTMNAVIHEDAPAAPAAGQLAPVIAALMHRDPAARPDADAAARMLATAGTSWPMSPPTTADGLQTADPAWLMSAPATVDGPRTADQALPMSAPTAADGPRRADQAWPASWTAAAQQAWNQPAAGDPLSGEMLHSAPVAPPGAGPRRPAKPTRAGARAARRRNRAVLTTCAAVAVVAAGVFGGFAIAHSTSSTGAKTGHTGTGTGHGKPGAGHAARPAAAATPASRTPQALPAGYSWYELPAASAGTAAGFRMAEPAGWSAARNGLATYLRNPSGAGYLEVDLTQHTKASNLAQARWLQLMSLRQHRFPGYRPISLRPARILGSPAAVWTFSWAERGVGRVIAQDYLFSAAAGGGMQSYAVYGSAPAPDWPQTAQALRAAVRTFQPVS